MAKRIDFNCDMGESFGAYKIGFDEEVMEYITSANIACGFHAGDPHWMRRTVQRAEGLGVGVGAHPGFPDLLGFGRRNLALTPEEAKDYVIYQVGALQAFTRKKRLQHVKPHGAFYNMAVRDEALARAIAEAILEIDKDLILVALAGSPWARIAESLGVKVAREVFADRAFNPDGTLVPRSRPGSVIQEVGAVVARSLKMVTQGKVTAITGEEIEISADTICLHGDNPEAVEIARTLRERFEAADIEVAPMGTFL